MEVNDNFAQILVPKNDFQRNFIVLKLSPTILKV